MAEFEEFEKEKRELEARIAKDISQFTRKFNGIADVSIEIETIFISNKERTKVYIPHIKFVL